MKELNEIDVLQMGKEAWILSRAIEDGFDARLGDHAALAGLDRLAKPLDDTIGISGCSGEQRAVVPVTSGTALGSVANLLARQGERSPVVLGDGDEASEERFPLLEQSGFAAVEPRLQPLLVAYV